MGKFNSDNHYIYYCEQESLRRNGVAIIVNKRVQNAVLGCNLKKDRMILVHFQDKAFNIIVIKSMPLPLMPKMLKLSGSMKTYNKLTPKKDVFSSQGTGMQKQEVKRYTWSNRQVWPWSIK